MPFASPARLACAVVPAILFSSALAAAQAAPPAAKPFGWDPSWRRLDAAEYTLTGVVALSAGGLHLFAGSRNDHPVIGPILLDGAVRDGLRAKGREDLVRARGIGDVLNASVAVHALVVDSLVVPLARGSGELAWQMTWMNAEAYGTSGLVTWVLFAVVGRARPSYRECKAGTNDDPLCGAGETAGFPSGHTASAFTSAGLTCAHHRHVPLYGGGLADTLTCLASLAVATGGGMMRLVGDRHYVTDVVAGAAIGFAAGYAMPTFLHYRAGKKEETASSRSPVKIGWALGADRAPLGASAFGVF